MKNYFFIAAILFLNAVFYAVNTDAQQVQRPKLVVGLVIDQMRWDYLYRYQDLYGKGGFNRLKSEGFNCENTFIPYIPTYTAAGHASIYTGSVPAINGIMGNNWYERTEGKVVYCTGDSTVNSVGTDSDAGKMSPDRLLVTSIGDELQLAENFRGKLIGISLKDRGAILPAGHTADAAYWVDEKTGNWITSTYYMKELPNWVKAINNRHDLDALIKQPWNLLLPREKYWASTGDSMYFESPLRGEKSAVFPHQISANSDKRYNTVKSTPYGVTHTFNFAKETIDAENLGGRGVTDFLAVSISSTDYAGHAFGPNSLEVEDVYLRLDRDLEQFLNYLDSALGRGNYLFFLSADHGASHVPAFNISHNIPAGIINEHALVKSINALCLEKFGIENAILNLQNHQLYLNYSTIEEKQVPIVQVTDFIINQLLKTKEVEYAFPFHKMNEYTLPEQVVSVSRNGYNPSRSGDIQIIPKPAHFDAKNSAASHKGTTHGAWNPYDAHIPLLFYGWNVKPGRLYRETYMTDIAATLAAMLHIQMPSGCIGHVIPEVFQ